MKDRFGARTSPERGAGDHDSPASVSFIGEHDRPADDASVDHRTLIVLLAQGLTDEAIGRRLGISSRTVRRRVAEIVHSLGAKSRFQAGVRAAQAGWPTAAGDIRTALPTRDVS